MRKIKYMILSAVMLAGLSISGNTAYADENIEQQINVCDFGADGSDEADDYQAIQECLDKARGSVGHTTIVIPKGNYYLSNALIIYSNTTLKLDDEAVMIRMDQAARLIQSEADRITGGYGQSENITITGGTWNGNIKTTEIKSELMRFNHARNIKLSDCNIKQGVGRHMVVFAGVDGIIVDKVNISDNRLYTGDDSGSNKYYSSTDANGNIDYFQSMRTAEALHMDCISKDGQSEGSLPLDGTVCKNITVTNCTFSDLMSAMGSHYSNSLSIESNYVVSNNTYKNIRFVCIDVYGYAQVKVRDNVAENVGEFLRTSASEVTIENNDIKCKTKADEFVGNNELYGILAFNQSIVNVTNNVIRNGKTHGISIVDKSRGSKVIDNTINNSGRKGINISASDVEVIGNKIKGCGENAIAFNQGSTGTVENNQIENSIMRGISILGNTELKAISNNFVENAGTIGIGVYEESSVSEGITNNKVMKADENGIYLSASKAKICNNVVFGAKKNGIYILSDASADLVAGNNVANAGENAIIVSGSDACIESNSISKSGKVGIVFYNGSTGTAKKNYIRDTGKNGINMNKNALVTEITSNTVLNAGSYGISGVVGSKMTDGIKSNTIKNSKDSGIYFSDSQGDIKSNVIQESRAEGIVLADNSVSYNMSKNKISKSKKEGISVNGGKADISGNEIENSGKDGINVKYANANISGNKLTQPQGEGIICVGITGSISANTISDAKYYGIHVYEKSSLSEIKGNTITSSGDNGISVEQFSEISIGINENVIKDCKKNSVYMSESYADIQKNSVTNTALTAILVKKTSNEEIVMSENVIDNVGENGISLEEAYAELSDNKISNVAKKGIDISKSNILDLDRNVLKKCGGDGISIKALSEVKRVYDNEFDEITGNGIYVSSTRVKNGIVNNIIRFVEKDGIYLSNSKSELSENEILSGKKNGIYITLNSACEKLCSNYVYGVANTGIYLKKSKAVVDSNYIFGTAGTGIVVCEDSVSEVIDNLIEGSGGKGIYINDVLEINKIDGNSIDNSKQEGIFINTCSFVENGISNNAIERSGADGIRIKDSVSDIMSNYIDVSGKNGINISNIKGYIDIEKNEICNSKLDGIYVEKTAVNLIENLIEDSKKSAIEIFDSNLANECEIGNNEIKRSSAVSIDINKSSNYVIKDNWADNCASDGLQIKQSKNITLIYNVFTGIKGKQLSVDKISDINIAK